MTPAPLANPPVEVSADSERIIARLRQTRFGVRILAGLYHCLGVYCFLLAIGLVVHGIWFWPKESDSEAPFDMALPFFLVAMGLAYYLPGSVLRKRGADLGRLIQCGTDVALGAGLRREGGFIAYLAQSIFLGIGLFMAVFICLMIFVWEPSAMLDSE